MRSTIARPSPVPLPLVVKNGSNRRSTHRRRNARPAVGDFDLQSCLRLASGQHQFAAVRHGIQGVEHQVQHGPPQHVGVGRRDQVLAGNRSRHEMSLGPKLRLERLQHVVQQARDLALAPGADRADWRKCSRSLTVASRAVKPADTLSSTSTLPSIVVDPPPQQAQVELHRHQAVAHLVGHVRRHLAQIGQAIFAGQLAVFRFQLVRQPADFAPQRFVRVLQAVGRLVPGGQNRLQVQLVGRGKAGGRVRWQADRLALKMPAPEISG